MVLYNLEAGKIFQFGVNFAEKCFSQKIVLRMEIFQIQIRYIRKIRKNVKIKKKKKKTNRVTDLIQ